MNRNDIIQLALKSGFSYEPRTGHILAIDGYTEVVVTTGLERFAQLIIEAEHERYIEECDDLRSQEIW